MPMAKNEFSIPAWEMGESLPRVRERRRENESIAGKERGNSKEVRTE